MCLLILVVPGVVSAQQRYVKPRFKCLNRTDRKPVSGRKGFIREESALAVLRHTGLREMPIDAFGVTDAQSQPYLGNVRDCGCHKGSIRTGKLLGLIRMEESVLNSRVIMVGIPDPKHLGRQYNGRALEKNRVRSPLRPMKIIHRQDRGHEPTPIREFPTNL
jgi:hypothetical protein